MNERQGALYTRRGILGLAVGVLAAGCATRGIGGAGFRARPAKGFPYPTEWCWKDNPEPELDKLGRIIMQQQNPYCTLALGTPCDPTKPATWPHELTDENTWKVLTEFDFTADPNDANQRWSEFAAASGSNPAVIPKVTRSMRIPYLIKQGKVKRKKHLPEVANLAREILFVGFESTGPDDPTATAWGTPGCTDDAVGELARFITDNMMRNQDAESFAVASWHLKQAGKLEEGKPDARWFFRRAPIIVDFSFRFPVATGPTTSGPKRLGWIYVGYEGGGAY